MGCKTPIGRIACRGRWNLAHCQMQGLYQGRRGKKKLVVKWDSFCKHVGRQKAERNMGSNVKKRDRFYSKVYKHAKNQIIFASYS
jgi:hypothetical protein